MQFITAESAVYFRNLLEPRLIHVVARQGGGLLELFVFLRGIELQQGLFAGRFTGPGVWLSGGSVQLHLISIIRFLYWI